MPIRELTSEEERQLLTEEEVDRLPDGTEIYVKWNGGNGPHKYLVVHTENGVLAVMPGEELKHVFSDAYLFPVGKERCHNRVFLAKPLVMSHCICALPAWKNGVCWHCGAKKSEEIYRK